MKSFYEQALECVHNDDYTKAMELYKKGEAEGDVRCSFGLARLFFNGQGIEKDEEKANGIFAKVFETIQTLAENGDMFAQKIMGHYYYYGHFVEKNDEKAIKWYEKSADQGDANAQFILACMYYSGEGVEQSYENAFFWYKKVAERGDLDAQLILACMYYGGEGVEQSYEKAAYWYTVTAEKGDASAQNCLAVMYEDGVGVEQSYEKAVYWYYKAVEQGYSRAQNNLAFMYYEGNGVEQSYKEAIYWWKKAAVQGILRAQFALGFVYDKGLGVSQADQKAVYWYKKAAKQDHSLAQEKLAAMYVEGRGVKQDYKKAFFWYEKSAKQRNRAAEYHLALLYWYGVGVEQSYEKAFFWYQKSAGQGDPFALCNLGIMYYKGLGIEQSYEKAVEYFQLATKGENPHKEAFYYLGDCYHNGFGIKADWKKAKECFEKAIELGYNCRYALEMVLVDLGEYSTKAEMRNYAESILELDIHGKERKERIEKDLAKDFGTCWDRLKENAKKALVSGVFSYLNFYELGEEIYKDMDFTPSITAMAKALEITLAEYFFKGYVAYLKKQNVSASIFDSQACFLKVMRDENGLELSREYRDEEETNCFSLGAFYYIIDSKFEVKDSLQMEDIQRDERSVAYRKTFQYEKTETGRIKRSGERTISKYMAEYADEFFAENAFSVANRKKEIVNYLVDLATDVFVIKKQRNPAAHGDTMSCAHAEVCGDYLIKVRKLICNFLGKVKG